VVAWIDNYNQPARHDMPPELAEQLGAADALHPEAIVRFSRWLGLDIMDRVSAPVRISRQSVSREVVDDPGSHRRTITWRTAAGVLREVIQSEPAQRTASHVEHLVKGPADLAALAAVFEDETYDLDAEQLVAIQQRRQLVGDDGITVLFMPGTPLGMMYRAFCGTDTLAYLYADAPESLDDLFVVMERAYRRQFQLAALAEVDALVTMDDTSTTIISPAMFERYNMALTDARADLAHRAGKLYLHHSCGHIRALLPLYRESAMDSVHFYSPPPLGDALLVDGLRTLRENQSMIPLIPDLFGNMRDLDAVGRRVRAMVDLPSSRVVPVLIPDPMKGMAETASLAAFCRTSGRKSPSVPVLISGAKRLEPCECAE